MYSFKVIAPTQKPVPIIISVPHCGTAFPDELVGQYLPKFVTNTEDTDWFVHQLYDFAPRLGITLIHANWSRYVVDLNRDPEQIPLYQDQRKQTSVIPESTFAGELIYKKAPPSKASSASRLDQYYFPYYQKIEALLHDLQKDHANVLLFDAHSINRNVKSIQTEPFKDLTLGDQAGNSCHPDLINTTLNCFKQSAYSHAHNDPFSGGHITRFFGQPDKKRHAMQLEMAQDVYMDPMQTTYQPARSEKIRAFLAGLFSQMIENLNGLNR